jgi:hypothetical protein
MTQAEERWRETTQDCNHCGGIILQRTAHSSAFNFDFSYYRCAQCGCEWEEGWILLKAGHGPQCQALGEQLQAEQVLAELKELPYLFSGRTWLYLLGGLLLFVVLARFGVIALLGRLALPLLLIGLIIGLIWLAFRQRQP